MPTDTQREPTRTALSTARHTLGCAIDAAYCRRDEYDHPVRAENDRKVDRAALKLLMNEITRLRAIAKRVREAEARLAQLEKWGNEYAERGGGIPIVELELFDDGEEPDRQWTVVGPRKSPAVTAIGEGATLAEAIDDAARAAGGEHA